MIKKPGYSEDFSLSNLLKPYTLDSRQPGLIKRLLQRFVGLYFSGKHNKKRCVLSTTKKTVLVVSHDATRSGAPILAWNICKELKSQFNVIALLLGDGEIKPFFSEICDVVFDTFPAPTRSFDDGDRVVEQIIRDYKIDFAIVNSYVSRYVLKALNKHFIPSVLLIHEFYAYSEKPDFITAMKLANATVFCTKIVQENATNADTQSLITSTHILSQGKSLVPRMSRNEALGTELLQIKEKIFSVNNQSKPFIVLGAGTLEYRKGVDLFIATADEIYRQNPEANIKMIWVGAPNPNELLYIDFLFDQIKRYGLKNKCEIVGSISTLEELYPLIDVFFLSSRLDPLPNVAIDAMMQGKPIVCFEKTTGVVEFLEQTTETKGCIVPFSNTSEAAKKILNFYQSPEYLSLISNKIKVLAEDNFDMKKYVEKLVELAVN